MNRILAFLCLAWISTASLAGICPGLDEMAPGHHARTEVETKAAREKRDLERLEAVHASTTKNLREKADVTLDSVLDVIANNGSVAEESVIVGAGPAGVATMLNQPSGRRSLVIAGWFSDVYSKPGNKTGGSDTIGETQDEHLFGGRTRASSSALKRTAFGEDGKGNNEVIGTTTLLHLDGAVDNLLLNSEVIGVEKAFMAKRLGTYSKWARKSPVRLHVRQILSDKGVRTLAKKMKIAGFEYKNVKTLADEMKQRLEANDVVLERTPDEGWALKFYVYTNENKIAVGLPSANNFVVEGASHARVDAALAHAAKAKESGERILIATADQKKDLAFDHERGDSTVISGFGDSAFVIMQWLTDKAEKSPAYLAEKREREIRQGSALTEAQKWALIRKHTEPSVSAARGANVQPRNTLALFDPAMKYFGRYLTLNGKTERVEYLDSQNHLTTDPAKAARVQTTFSDLKGIHDMDSLAGFFHKTPKEFVEGGYLPASYFKPGEFNTLEGLKQGALDHLLETSFGARGQLEARLIALYGEKNVKVKHGANDSIESVTITSDFMGMASGYNGNRVLQGVMGMQGKNGHRYIPLFEFDTSRNVSPALTNGQEVVTQHRVVGYREIDAEGNEVGTVMLPENQRHSIALRGVANQLVGQGQLVDPKAPNPRNSAMVRANDRVGHNSSPMGLQSNIGQISEAERQLAAGQAASPLNPDMGYRQQRDGSRGQSLHELTAEKFRREHPDREVVAGGEPQYHEIALAHEVAPDGDLPRDKPVLENQLFHTLFSQFFLKVDAAHPNHEGKVVFTLQNGKLRIGVAGSMAHNGGRSSFAETLAKELQRHPELLKDLGSIVKAMGGEASVNFRVLASGLVENQSIRLNTTVDSFSNRARELTRTSGSKGLKAGIEQNYQELLSLLTNIADFPATEGEGENKVLKEIKSASELPEHFKTQILEHARRLGISESGKPLEIGRIENVKRQDKKTEEYILHLSSEGKEVGAIIIGAGQDSMLRMSQYLLGAKRVEEQGAPGVRVLDAQRNTPNNDQERFPRLVWYTKYAPGTVHTAQEIESRPDLLGAFGESLADFMSRGGEIERKISSAEDLQARHAGFMNGKNTDLALRTHGLWMAGAIEAMRDNVPPAIWENSFYHGPVLGETVPKKISFTEQDGRLRAGWMNFYTSRGWGNVLVNLGQFTSALDSPQAKAIAVRSFVRRRYINLKGGEPTPDELVARVDEIMRALPYFETMHTLFDDVSPQ